jgi:spore germination protein
MVGWLDEIQTNYLKWITDYAEGGTLTVESPDNPKKQVCLEMKSLKTDVKPVVEGEEITFNINTKGTFNIAEINHEHGKRAFEEDFVKEVERIAEKKAEKQMRETIEFIQKEYGADTLFFYQVMQRYAPDTWDKVEKDWDNIFPKVKTNIKVSIKIEQIGLIK